MELNSCKPRPELPVSNDDEDEVEFSHTGSNSRDHNEGHCLEKDQKIKDKEKDEDDSDPDNDPKTAWRRMRSNLARRHLEPFSITRRTLLTPPRLKTSSWGKDLNNIPDTNDWRQAERSIVNAPTISAPPINEPPISEPRIHFISESEPIRMTISTEESGKRDKGLSDPTHSLPEVKSLFDDCKTGDERKTSKLHGKPPKLPSQNSNKGLLEYRNTYYYRATNPGLLDRKGEFESRKYTRSIEGADNKSVLYQARRPDKSSHLEKPHELNPYKIYYKDGKELEINKKTRLSDQ